MVVTLSDTQRAIVEHTTKVCKDLGIDTAVFSHNMVRGINEERTVVIVHEFEKPIVDTPDVLFGTTRLPTLHDRLGLIRASATVELTQVEGKDHFTLLESKSDNCVVEFRFGDPELIEYPKRLKGDDIAEFTLTPEQVRQIVQSARAFGPSTIWFILDSKGITVEMYDVANDKMSLLVSRDPVVTETIRVKYHAGVTLKVIQQRDEVTRCTIKSTNMMVVDHYGLTVGILRSDG